MFDKLVESTSTGADAKPRRTIFAATFLFVAVLFATALVAGIYAASFDLGNNNFDVAQLLTPIAETEPQPEQEPARQQPQDDQNNQSDRTSRVMNILRIDEPQITPPTISTVRSPYLSRPPGTFELNPRGTDSNGPPVTSAGDQPEGSSSSSSQRSFPVEGPDERESPPPPAEIKNPTMRSEGVVNGKATHLPKPVYSAAAQAVRAQGKVDVQVTIDEFGNVISAKAVSGHPLLKAEAVKAAWKARFSPTLLSKVPVKVTGVIVYNFTR